MAKMQELDRLKEAEKAEKARQEALMAKQAPVRIQRRPEGQGKSLYQPTVTSTHTPAPTQQRRKQKGEEKAAVAVEAPKEVKKSPPPTKADEAATWRKAPEPDKPDKASGRSKRGEKRGRGGRGGGRGGEEREADKAGEKEAGKDVKVVEDKGKAKKEPKPQQAQREGARSERGRRGGKKAVKLTYVPKETLEREKAESEQNKVETTPEAEVSTPVEEKAEETVSVPLPVDSAGMLSEEVEHIPVEEDSDEEAVMERESHEGDVTEVAGRVVVTAQVGIEYESSGDFKVVRSAKEERLEKDRKLYEQTKKGREERRLKGSGKIREPRKPREKGERNEREQTTPSPPAPQPASVPAVIAVPKAPEIPAWNVAPSHVR